MSTEPKVLALGFTFDATKVAPQTAAEAFPAGWYRVQIRDGSTTTNDNGQGKRIAMEFEIVEGQFAKRRAFDGLQVKHSNPQTEEIGQKQLSGICHAVSVFQLNSVDQLFNKPFDAKFDIEVGKWVNADNEEVAAPAPGTPIPPGYKYYEAKNRYRGCRVATVPGGIAPPAGAAPAPATPAAPAPSWAAQAPAAGATPPPAAAPAAPAKGKPGRKPGSTNKPKPAATERKFYVDIDQPEFAEAITESKLAEYVKLGMPANTPICLDGEQDYKTAADYGIAGTVVTSPPVAAPVAAPVAPAPAPAPTGNVPPPWGR